MTELGNKLREAREKKDLSLRDISQITKIQIRYLNALEKNEYDIFPGDVYIKGALKNYAEVVGLSPEEIIKLYSEQNTNNSDSNTDETLSSNNVPSNKNVTKVNYKTISQTKNNKKPIIIGILLVSLCVIFFLGYYILPIISDGLETDTENNQIGNDELNDEDGADDDINRPQDDLDNEELDNTFSIELVNESNNRDEFIIKGIEEIELEIKFSSRCWIRVTEDDKIIKEGNFSGGQNYNLTTTKDVIIRLGAPKGVSEIKINNEIIPVKNQDGAYNIVLNLEK